MTSTHVEAQYTQGFLLILNVEKVPLPIQQQSCQPSIRPRTPVGDNDYKQRCFHTSTAEHSSLSRPFVGTRIGGSVI